MSGDPPKDQSVSKAIVAGLAAAWSLTKAVLSAPYEGTFGQWMAHGSTEVANVLLHGHAAPVYAHSLSPADDATTSSLNPSQPDSPEANSVENENVAEVANEQQPELATPVQVEPVNNEANVTSFGRLDDDAPSRIDALVEQVRAQAPQMEHEHELSR